MCLKCFITKKEGNAARRPLRHVTRGQAPSGAYEPPAALTNCGTFASLQGEVMLIWLSIAFFKQYVVAPQVVNINDSFQL